jgi:hypothetical protein
VLLSLWDKGALARWTLWGPALFGSRAENFGAPLFGASTFKFWGLRFSGDLGLFGAPR